MGRNVLGVKREKMVSNAKVKNQKQERRIDAIFCILVLLIPTVQFFIFYIGVHTNSLLLAFKKYDESNNYTFVGFVNVANAFKSFVNDTSMALYIKNSFILYACDLFIGVTITVLFSYAIFKKTLGYGFMRVMLFLPSIISPIVMVTMFRHFVGNDSVVPKLVELLTGNKIKGLLNNEDTRKATLIFYTIWISFGAKILLYSGAMSGINESVLEAAKMDGVNNIQELWHIVVPLIFPTFSTFIVVGVAGLFTNQMSLFSFFGGENKAAESFTLGYHLYLLATKLSDSNKAPWPNVAALGVCISVVCIPLTFLVKYLLEKLGPKVD